MIFNTKGRKELLYISKQDILNKATAEEIFAFYLGFEPEIKRMYVSPLRKDKIASFNVYYNNSGELMFKDFGGSQGSFVDLVMVMYNISYEEALFTIYKDLNLGLRKESIVSLGTNKQKNTLIQCKLRKFEDYDLSYWGDYGISYSTLCNYNVYAISHCWLNGKLIFISTKDNPMYCYHFPKTGKVKVYRPLAQCEKKKNCKWLSNVSSIDIQGLEQLPDSGRILIISKAMKDVMLLKELGIISIAPQGEGMYIPKEIIQDLWKRFKRIITVYDNDEPGVLASIKLNSIIGSEYWNIPKKFKEKDITDFYKAHGKNKTMELIKPLYE